MSKKEKPIPEGYRVNAEGNLVDIDSIKPIDLQRDALVLGIVGVSHSLSRGISDFKLKTFEMIETFVETSAKQYKAKLGGQKGNVTLMSFDGRYKIIRSRQDHLVFDERLQAAKSLIDDCLREWTAGARHEIVTLINRAFEVDKEGNISVGRVLALRRVDITDKRWKRAMDALSDALQVVGTKSYIRVYQRVGSEDKWEQIPLDVASA